MDGTLLQSNGKISANNIEIIKKSKIPFTLVSARSPKEMFEVIDLLALSEPQIAFNGGLIFQLQDGKVKALKEDTIVNDSVARIVELCKKEFPSVSCSFYGQDTWYIDRMDSGIEMEKRIGGQTPKMVDFVTLLKQAATKIYKIMFITMDLQKMKPLIARLKELGENVSINQSGQRYLEITSQNAEKSEGIGYIKKLENLDKEEMAAFGDGFNDVSMLKSVGVPIVMDNALEGVHNYGKYITKDNDHDGVGHGIQKYLI